MERSTIDGDSRSGVADRLLYGRTDARLRAVWRVLAPLAVGIGIYVLGHVAVELYGGDVLAPLAGESAVLGAAAIFAALAVAVATAGLAALAVAARLDRRSIADYGFDRSRRWQRDLLAGVGIGAAAGLGTVGYLAARGYATLTVELTGVGADSALVGAVVLVAMLAFLLANTAFEEIVFRAILITNAAEGFRSRSVGAATAVVGAVAVSVPVFGALHLLGGGNGAVVTSAIGGILLAAAYVLTGRLALPIGVHFGGISFVSATQSPLSAEPELTLPSLVAVADALEPSLLASVELWLVRLAIGLALVCAWVRLADGELSIADRVSP